jgi:hypothetical protein
MKKYLLFLFFAFPAFALDNMQAVSPTEGTRFCKVDDDCVMIDKSCGDCCSFDAVAKAHQDVLLSKRDSFCESLSDKIACDCDYRPSKPKLTCIEQRCNLTFVKE